MNPISFLNPYQMTLIEREYACVSSIYLKESRLVLQGKCDEYLLEFFTQYYNEKRMPTIEAINDIRAQVSIIYRIVAEKEFPKHKLLFCLGKLAERAYFPRDEKLSLAYTHLAQHCADALYRDRDSFFADKEKCEVFIRRGWLSEKARYPECITARHEPRYEVFYKEDFSVYKEPVSNDCVCP